MTFAAVLGVVLGAAVGAQLRFATDRFFIGRFGTAFPYGTLVVNLVGSLVLGLLTGALLAMAHSGQSMSPFLNEFIGTGCCGALTTFSGFSSQVLELSRGNRSWAGPAYAIGSLVLGVALATLGYGLASGF